MRIIRVLKRVTPSEKVVSPERAATSINWDSHTVLSSLIIGMNLFKDAVKANSLAELKSAKDEFTNAVKLMEIIIKSGELTN
jgi:hypothetical protein